jgi:uncharacterized protein YbgA (DUF1722 family)
VAPRSQRDWSGPMRRFAADKVRQIAAWGLDGFVLKAGSPSCGPTRVRVYDERGGVRRDGVGLFAEALVAALPLLPVEDEGRLRDPLLREAFLVRARAYHEARTLFARPFGYGELVALHTRWKLQLLAASPEKYRALGRLVATGRRLPDVGERYLALMMAALAAPATAGGHANALQHLAGHFKHALDGESRRELAELIDRYRTGHEPRAAAVALVRHHARTLRAGYVAAQTYLAAGAR